MIDNFINLFNHNVNMVFGKKKQGHRTIDDVLEDLPVEKRKKIEQYIDNVEKGYAPSSKDIVKEMGSCLKDFAKGKYLLDSDFLRGLSAGIYANMIPYAVATNVRIHAERSEVFPYVNNKADSSKFAGQFFGGIIGGAAHLSAYVIIATYLKHPEVFLIPLTTNSISAVYELRKAAKARLVDKHKRELEDKI